MPMSLEQYLLGRVAEECSELAKAAMKAQSFGMDSYSPKDRTTGDKVIDAEYVDVETVYGMLNEVRHRVYHTGSKSDAHLRKRVKVILFLRRALSANTVVLTPEEQQWADTIANNYTEVYVELQMEHAFVVAAAALGVGQ